MAARVGADPAMTKRAIDIAVSALALVLLSPLLLALALWIKWDSPGPVFFRQERVGLHGRRFRIFKFRTMVAVQPPGGLQVTASHDPRITRAGAFLRRTKLDELPQLIDVLRGTMSLVGPRPEVPRYVSEYPDQRRQTLLSVRPGITDFASLRFRDEGERLARAADPEREYLEVILPEKLRLAAHSVEHASLAADMRALGLTLRTVFLPRRPLQKVRTVIEHPRFWSRLALLMERQASRRTRWLAVGVDALVVLACWHLTYLFRLGVERWQPGRPWYDDLVSVGVVLAYLAALQVAGVRRALWRFFAFDDMRRIVLACLAAGLFSAVWVLMAQLVGVARAVLVLHPVFTMVGLVLVRMLVRMLWEQAYAVAGGAAAGDLRRAIVMGAGETARRLVAGLHRRQGWKVLALLDDSPGLQGARIAGVPVAGPMARVRDPSVTAGATHVIVALTAADGHARDAALTLALDSGLTVLTVPETDELSTVAEPGAA